MLQQPSWPSLVISGHLQKWMDESSAVLFPAFFPVLLHQSFFCWGFLRRDLDSCYLDVFQKRSSSGLSKLSQWGQENKTFSQIPTRSRDRGQSAVYVQFNILRLRPVSGCILLSLIMLASYATILCANEADIAVTIYPAQPTVLRLYWPELCSSKFTVSLSASPSNKQH